MEADAENQSRVLGGAPKVQLKRERSENMSKEIKSMMGISTENSLPELMEVFQLWPGSKKTSIGPN